MLDRMKSMILAATSLIGIGCSREPTTTSKPFQIYSDGEGSISLDELTSEQSELLFRGNPRDLRHSHRDD